MKNLSVFGSTGFIGNKFTQMYPENVIKIDRNSRHPESKEVLYLISTVDNYNVFHDVHLDVETNLTILLETLENCREKDLVFNFVSSWFVYGNTEDLPANEESYCNPKGFYSITKRTAEQLLISYCETFDIKYRIFRLCNVCGFEDSKVSIKKNALQYLIGEIVNNRDVNLYDGGTDIRDFMDVEDVCSAIKLCIDKGEVNKVFNIGSGIPRKIGDIMDYVKKKSKSTSKLTPIQRPKFHEIVQVKDMYLDVSRIRKLGFKPKIDFMEKIDTMIEKYKEKK